MVRPLSNHTGRSCDAIDDWLIGLNCCIQEWLIRWLSDPTLRTVPNDVSFSTVDVCTMHLSITLVIMHSWSRRSSVLVDEHTCGCNKVSRIQKNNMIGCNRSVLQQCVIKIRQTCDSNNICDKSIMTLRQSARYNLQTNLQVKSRRSSDTCCHRLVWRRSKSRCYEGSSLRRNETVPAWTEYCCYWYVVRKNFVVHKLFEQQSVSALSRWSRDKCWRHCSSD